MTRRELLWLPLLAPAGMGSRVLGQNKGMASRGVKPLPRPKLSGLPFHSRLVNVAKPAGLTAPVIFGPVDHCDYILETMGCGAAFIDYDNDGWMDLVVLTGQRFAGNPPDAIIRLYRNNRDGTFRDVTTGSGLGRGVWAFGITVGDYDNDGFDDLFVTCWGQNILFHNNGDGTFTDVTDKAGLLHAGKRWGAGCTWLDYDRDGRLDLFVSRYLDFDPGKVPARGKDAGCNYRGVPVNCGPAGLVKERCALYHNNGDGTFTDVSQQAGIASHTPGFGLTAVAADFDGDGWADIYVACDTTYSLFFRNNHDGTFTEQALESGVALNDDGKEQSGMGLGVGDFDTDGRLDILKTHFADDTPALYRNEGKGAFRDMTIQAGLGVETRFVCWGAGMYDLDNDGLPELFYATGGVYPEVEPYKTRRVLYRNLGGGKFEEIGEYAGPGAAEERCSRGVAFGDFDNDGDLDILVVNMNEPPSLLRNDVSGNGHWLKVQLVGTKSNRSAIGATVIAGYGGRRQAQAVLAQSGYLSANDRRLHFGLGRETSADLEIRWPNGAVEKIARVPANRLVVVREGSGVMRTDDFRAARRGA